MLSQYSGNIPPIHGGDPGSIPGEREQVEILFGALDLIDGGFCMYVDAGRSIVFGEWCMDAGCEIGKAVDQEE